MGKIGVLLASVTLALGMLFLVSYVGNTGVGEAQAQTLATASAKPNIVFILADDMRKDDLRYMPKTRNLLQEKGITFQNAFVSNALCCPSRATIMRGQYSHNDGVWTNSTGPSGGWQAYQQNDNEKDNVATRLDGAGYRTALIGKYLNRYADTTYIPPGWDRWFATWGEYFDYRANDNGTIRHYGTSDGDYHTDVLSARTDQFISYSASIGKPFFAYVSPKAPHMPATPAPRDTHTYDGVKAPRPSSFNEEDISDKPPWIREQPRLTSDRIAYIDKRHEKRAESLQAVDDLVRGVVSTLRNEGVLSNTYIFFTSDNGFHEGEHRIPGEKWRPYEEDIHMPLVVRGPGIAAGSSTNKLILNTDYLPTFTNLAGAQPPPTSMDAPCYRCSRATLPPGGTRYCSKAPNASPPHTTGSARPAVALSSNISSTRAMKGNFTS